MPLPHLPARYQQLTATVFTGGFSHAVKVHDTYLGRDVLFKSLQAAVDKSLLETEVRALAKARSRHVVEIYDVIYDPNAAITGIIIELLTGPSYTDFHQCARSAPRDYLKTLYQIATALRDLHSAGVVHRDLKLENMKETGSGILKLFDFGISSTGHYITTNNRGTLSYAAPELFSPSAVLTPEMDIYALGVCAWALATASLPPALLEIPPQSRTLPPSLGSVFGEQIESTLIDIIDKCVNPDPRLRPTAYTISNILGRELVRGLHRGLFVQNGREVFELSDSKKNVRIAIAGFGELRVKYDGLAFTITGIVGDVRINNTVARPGDSLPDACLCTFVPSSGKPIYIPFSSSHPEVIL